MLLCTPDWPLRTSTKTFRKLYRLAKLLQHTAPEKGMNNIHGWPFHCRAVLLLFPESWDNRYRCREIKRRDYGTVPTGKCIKQQLYTRFLHCHYMHKCFSIRKVTDLLLKSMQTVVIVQVTEQAILAWQQRCPVLLQALLFLFASITIHSCQEAQTNRLATILLSTCCTKRGSFFHPKKRPVTTFVQLPY